MEWRTRSATVANSGKLFEILCTKLTQYWQLQLYDSIWSMQPWYWGSLRCRVWETACFQAMSVNANLCLRIGLSIYPLQRQRQLTLRLWPNSSRNGWRHGSRPHWPRQLSPCSWTSSCSGCWQHSDRRRLISIGIVALLASRRKGGKLLVPLALGGQSPDNHWPLSRQESTQFHSQFQVTDRWDRCSFWTYSVENCRQRCLVSDLHV